MKRTLLMALVAAGLFASLPALAQVPMGDPNAYPPAGGAAVDPATGAPAAGTYQDDYYRQTGWDPSLYMLATGGLAAGSLLLKSRARRRA